MQKVSKTPCVVLGMSVNGLSVARSLGRRGIKVIGVDYNRSQPGLYSRYCKPLICPHPLNQTDAFLKWLKALAGNSGKKPALMITADDMMGMVADNRDQISRYYSFMIPPPHLFNVFMNKTKTLELLIHHNIDIPRTWIVRNMDELFEASREVEYPCILKPAYSHLWKSKIKGMKVSIIHTPDQLAAWFRKAESLNLTTMIQEIIPGDDSHLCTYLAYYNNKSDPLCKITKRKLRQCPPHFGDGSFQVVQHIPKIIEISDRFLRAIGYTGLAGIEFKLDPRDGRFKFIENNMRTVSGNELLAQSGADFPYVYYRDMTGCPVRLAGPFHEGIKLTNFPWDCTSLYYSWRQGELTLRQWLRSYRGNVCHANFAKDDPFPLVIYYLTLLKKIVR